MKKLLLVALAVLVLLAPLPADAGRGNHRGGNWCPPRYRGEYGYRSYSPLYNGDYYGGRTVVVVRQRRKLKQCFKTVLRDGRPFEYCSE
ncbi:MAG: hypothetical protein HY470_00945 [Candidatus Ryanbacteria bacterium]|nr:hypothetical protein [Candidatus Ryanbacteria bacterium]